MEGNFNLKQCVPHQYFGVHMDDIYSVLEVLTGVAKLAAALWVLAKLIVKKSKKRRTRK